MKFSQFKTRVFSSFIFLIALAVSATSVNAQQKAAPLPGDNIALMGGVMRVTPLFHASLMLEYRGKVILVDPVSAASPPKKADLILITHSHPDHFDKAAIIKWVKPSATIVFPSPMYQAANALSSYGYGSLVLSDKVRVSNRVVTPSIESVPAYNIVRGPKAGQKYHPKGQWNGYVLTIGGKKIYIAGDTEATPEMKALKNITVAFVPMNLPYTMTPQEAAAGVRAFKPRFVYPYHYRSPFNKANTNPQQFASALRGSGIQVRIREWYPSAAVARASQARN